ncbi:GNAT family N-acetyltransferase [Xylanimonas protaetiae]|uniref:GNAT family N-acetyltransferase n=1 Tax=Xylanimonas protaetiae TaxID=2509457 RepID=A0A4P6F8A7_9MICO|nr:GNAT family N-acetyltransferase [Xylanimonas protaetiae]QAY71113.1 GNAT family N-acetyltransferase [Xylanimonas protaetiae]
MSTHGLQGPAERLRGALPVPGVPAAWATHPVVVTESAHHGWDVVSAWSDDDALLLRLRRQAVEEPGTSADPGLYAVGTPDGAARLILAAASRDGWPPVGRTTTPRGTRAALAALAAASGIAVPAPFGDPATGHWDWLGIGHEPPRLDGEERVEELTDPAEVRAILALAHPAGELEPTEPRSRWWGWRDAEGVLRGVVGADRRVPGAPWVLGSIGTDPAWRGRGIAAATTAAAVRAGLREAPIVTLGMYADNDAARRTYRRVGFAVVQEFESTRGGCGAG